METWSWATDKGVLGGKIMITIFVFKLKHGCVDNIEITGKC